MCCVLYECACRIWAVMVYGVGNGEGMVVNSVHMCY